MRWFRGHAEAPKLLSLSPLQAEEDLHGASYHFHAASQYRDMSPVRWARRKSSSSESERNCYNVQTSQVTTERSANKKDKKRIQEERRRICEKRNPLLDRVKNTRLSFFKDRDSEEEEEEREEDEPEQEQFRSMCELSQRGLTRNEFRRSICETDLKEITEEERTQAKRKRRSKSQSRLPHRKQQEERFSFFRTSTPQRQEWPKEEDILAENTLHQSRKWRKSKDYFSEDRGSRGSFEQVLQAPTSTEDSSFKDGSQFDSITPSSCLAAKFRAMQDRYLKSSTSKLIAKIYKKDGKDRERRRLRSFSYGTLPGLEELRTNPLYEEQDQDDNDSGILDNDSATSSLLDDRCSSGTSGLLTNTALNESSTLGSPPQLPPRKPPSSIVDVERATRLFSSLDVYCGRNGGRGCLKDNVKPNAFVEPTKQICQAANSELIDRQREREISLKFSDTKDIDRLESKNALTSNGYHGSQLSPIRNRTYTTETMVVKLPRESTDQCLGIFIAKTAESSPGYLVAHVVPNGLADKEGTLRIGDEILIVNGKRLRGLSMSEARKILGNGSAPGEVDIVVSRYTELEQTPKKLKESSVDYENVHMENGHGVIIENSPKSHFKKNQTKYHRERKSDSSRSISSEKSSTTMVDNTGSTQSVSNFCTLPRRPRSTVSTFLTVVFQKGPGKKSLGFTIVGGRDSPKGSIGIFIKSVLPGGQAAEDGRLRAGDEILAVNGHVCHDLTHREAVQLFRNIKAGPVALHLCRRVKNKELQPTKAKSCADLLIMDT